MMLTIASELKSAINQKLGRCPYCTKTAFLYSLTAWAVAMAAQLFWLPAAVVNFAIAVAVGLTILWLLHFLFYTVRVFGILRSEYGHGRAQRKQAIPDARRRNALAIIGNAVCLGVFASVWIPNRALAGNPCRPGRRCPDDAPNCCSRTSGICCNGNWHCGGNCYKRHADARRRCGSNARILACS